MIRALEEGSLSKSELAQRLGLKGVSEQLNRTIALLVERGVVELTIPEKKQSRLQKYRLVKPAAGR